MSAGFRTIPGSQQLTFWPAFLPPFTYWLAATLLPPFKDGHHSLAKVARSCLAISSAVLFARLPACYHIQESAGVTYILALTGCYGATRVIDVFFLSPAIPRRYRRRHEIEEDSAVAEDEDDNQAMGRKLSRRKSFVSEFVEVMKENPMSRKRRGSISTEKAEVESAESTHQWRTRMVYALDLILSMRGVGWSWTTADVRYTRKSWLPSLHEEIRQLLLSDLPMVLLSCGILRYIYLNKLDPAIGYASLSVSARAILTLAQGVFLFGTFSLGYTAGALITSPLRSPHKEWSSNNLSFWPQLNSKPLTSVTTVRGFWSTSWHRLFSRLFTVWGVWPGQWIERAVCSSKFLQRYDPQLDVGKVLGAFFISGITHSIAGIAINGGQWSETYEYLFFWVNGIAVVLEELVKRTVISSRGTAEPRPYDFWVGRVWTLAVLLSSGQLFTISWLASGLIKEMAQVW